MTPLLVLAFAATCLAQNSASDLTKTGTGTDPNDPDKKFFQLPFVTADQSNSLWGGALGAGAALLGQQVLNGVLGGGGGGGNPCGRKRREAQDPNDPDTKFLGGLFGGSSNNCQPQTNPCGRKRRQTDGTTDTGEKVDTKFFGLFGNSGGNNCGNYQQQPQYQQPQYQQPQYQQPQYQQPQYQQPQYQQPQNQQPQFNTVCQCASPTQYESFSKLDNYNQEEARCAKADHTNRRWCYSTSNSNCPDAQSSKKYRNNPWSYMACGNNGR